MTEKYENRQIVATPERQQYVNNHPGLAWVARTSSVITLVAIAAERYFAVIYPAGNVGKVTKRKLKVRGLQSSIIPNYLRVFFLSIRIYSNSDYAGTYEKDFKQNALLVFY